MQTLRQNQETGFLESKNNFTSENYTVFDSDKKVQFLALVNQCIDEGKYPAIDAICKYLNVSPRSFNKHVLRDHVFATAWGEVKARLSHVYTEKLAVKADSKMGTLANLAILRYLESGTWCMNASGVQMIPDNTPENKLENARKIILDAELSDNSGELPAK